MLCEIHTNQRLYPDIEEIYILKENGVCAEE